jgi:hypothetical protein
MAEAPALAALAIDLAQPGCNATWRLLDRLHACAESARRGAGRFNP